jgi:N utilization substance protein B
VYELVKKDTPKNVVIDEAVELAKEFGTEQSHKFVNGVLSSISQEIEKRGIHD